MVTRRKGQSHRTGKTGAANRGVATKASVRMQVIGHHRERVSADQATYDALHGPLGPSFTVRRNGLVRDMVRQAQAAGVIVMVAPSGFGKTALLLQYAEEVARDPARGSVKLADAAGCTCADVLAFLDACERDLPVMTRPLVAIDNVPLWSEEDAGRLANRLRGLRGNGFEFVLTMHPTNRALRDLLPDAAKFGAQALAVRPREFPAWARAFSISSGLDVYELTQGVPFLVASLASASTEDDARALLGARIDALYRSVLDDLHLETRGMSRVACMMLLMGSGSMTDIERSGMRLATDDLVRLTRDYPVFGYEVVDRRFTCLGAGTDELDGVQGEIARHKHELVARAVRALVKADRVDQAVTLASTQLKQPEMADMVARFPTSFTLAGHATWVLDVVTRARRDEEAARDEEPDVNRASTTPRCPLALARFASALVLGDFKQAREAAMELARAASAIANEVDATDWALANALARVWESALGVGLPVVSYPRISATWRERVAEIDAYTIALSCVVGPARPRARAVVPHATSSGVAIDLPYVLCRCGELVEEVRSGTMDRLDERDAELERLIPTLRSRGLVPIVMIARAVVSTRRMFAGLPVVDERVFTDAGTLAVRVSDQPMQLLCLLLEGWRELVLEQPVNALFRAQQVQRLSEGRRVNFLGWAVVLEKAAHLKDISRLAACEEAELLDLSQRECSPADAWSVAFTLAAARADAELSAWCSMRKRELFDHEIKLPARLAMYVLGPRGDVLRRLIPPHLYPGYLLGDEQTGSGHPLFEVLDDTSTNVIGQVTINLFGGFKVIQGGHTVTDALWRRRKTSVLAARLVLAMGALVSRRVLMEELWPDYDYTHARGSLYSALFTLRRAFGQTRDGGPEYVITQGEGVAINTEYVHSDVMRFNMLAREVLLKRTGISAPQLIDACLKIEQLYTGQLFVPDAGKPLFFARMRSLLQTKFTDCMLRGVDTALDEEDYSSASWLVEAALRFDSLREDVIRAAMRVYNLVGRRREIVELYQTHLQELEREAKGLPEPETRSLYEDIIGDERSRGVV